MVGWWLVDALWLLVSVLNTHCWWLTLNYWMVGYFSDVFWSRMTILMLDISGNHTTCTCNGQLGFTLLEPLITYSLLFPIAHHHNQQPKHCKKHWKKSNNLNKFTAKSIGNHQPQRKFIGKISNVNPATHPTLHPTTPPSTCRRDLRRGTSLRDGSMERQPNADHAWGDRDDHPLNGEMIRFNWVFLIH